MGLGDMKVIFETGNKLTPQFDEAQKASARVPVYPFAPTASLTILRHRIHICTLQWRSNPTWPQVVFHVTMTPCLAPRPRAARNIVTGAGERPEYAASDVIWCGTMKSWRIKECPSECSSSWWYFTGLCLVPEKFWILVL